MKTLLFSNQGLSPQHLGIELEIIESQIKSKIDLSILYCKSNLESCFFNSSHNLFACSICEARSLVFYNQIKFPKSKLFPLENKITRFDLNQIQDMDDVFNIRYKGYDIGRGIAASYISTRRDYEYQNEDFEFIHQMALMCANIIENIEFQIKNGIKAVILFNGRFAEQNAVIEVCTKLGIDYFTYERSSAKGKYKFFKNMLPHSLANRALEMERHWKNGNSPKREQIAHDWFTDRQKGGSGLIKKFLAKQKTGALPIGFNSQKTNISIFITSEDEHKTVKEHHFDQYNNQNEAIKLIIKEFENTKGYQFYLRVHPNLRNIDSDQTREIKKLKFSNLHIINAEEKIDSYELIRASDKIISFGSTTGIEATYLGKPSILFGKSYYMSLDCAYYPKNYSELFKLILLPNLKAKPIENTLPYSYYQSTVGITYTKYNDGGKKNSNYNSRPIKRIYPKTIWTFVRNIPQFGKWVKMNRLIFKEKLNIKNMIQLNSHLLNKKLN